MIEVRLTPEATKQFELLPRGIKVRVTNLIERLRAWPAVSGVKSLRGKLAGHFRLRTGDFRLQFTVRDKIITIEKIGHRDGFYED